MVHRESGLLQVLTISLMGWTEVNSDDSENEANMLRRD